MSYVIAAFAIFIILGAGVLYIVNREIECDRLPEDEYFQWRKKGGKKK